MMLEASDTIKPEHTDEYLLDQENAQGYLLHFPAEYRAAVVERVKHLRERSNVSASGAIIAVRSELDCQLRAPVFDISEADAKRQRETLEGLLRCAVMAADDAAMIRTSTEHECIVHLVRAAIGTLLANKMIEAIPYSDWIKIGYPRHLM